MFQYLKTSGGRQTELYQQVKETNEQLELANKELEIHDKMQQIIDIKPSCKLPNYLKTSVNAIVNHFGKLKDKLEAAIA